MYACLYVVLIKKHCSLSSYFIYCLAKATVKFSHGLQFLKNVYYEKLKDTIRIITNTKLITNNHYEIEVLDVGG